MIKLIDLLTEYKRVGYSSEPTMIQLVFWDSKGGLKDIKKQKEILRVLQRNLIVQSGRGGIEYSVPTIMSGMKYYPSTDKIVGNFPKAVFVHSKKNSIINMDTCRFKDELIKVSRTLEVKQK